ncbi:MAG: ThiF family adenylyltransferase [Planctomycetota bacterium]|jgi:molybdopterin/thiamine biosynthesis adenylyltransferase
MLNEQQKTQLEQAFDNGSKTVSCGGLEKIAVQLQIPLSIVEQFLLEKDIIPPRYQYNIGSLGADGQKKLLESSVIIVGLGGLGGYVAENLARSGIGKIIGIDPDKFEESNLNRQLLADKGSLGSNKTEKAKERIAKVNPAVEFKGYSSFFDEVDDKIFNTSDLIFDCLDNAPDRFLLEKKCNATNIVLIHGAIAGWYGQIAVIWPGTNMFEKIYKSQNKGIEKNIGNLPFSAAVAASLMAAEGIKVLLEKNVEKKQKVTFFDLLRQDWQPVYFE